MKLFAPLILREKTARGLTKTLRIMKLTAFFLLAFCLHVSADGNAQNISLSEKNVSLEKVFKAIKRQTGYDFWYENKLLQKGEKVTVVVNNKPLEEVLDQCFKNQPFTWSIVGKIIVVKTKEEKQVNEVIPPPPPPPVEIKGRIVNEKGEPVASASIAVKETNIGTTSNANGEFVLEVPEGKKTLVISSVGYETAEVNINRTALMNVTLKLKPIATEELVIIGYGSVRKKDLTGSVVSLKQDQITSTPVTNVLETMQGKVAGLDLTRASGETGAGMNFTIRGNRSLNASNQPLVLVDGIQYGSYIDINPNDIASIEILKDASSTAIYGSRGANGVILITTKTGSRQTKIELNNYVGFNTLGEYSKPSTLGQYVAVTREAFRNAGQWNSPADDPSIFKANYPLIQSGVSTDWTELLVHDGLVNSHHIAVSGGTEKLSLRLSSEYFREQGFLKSDVLNRFVQHLNADYKITPKLKIGTTLNFNSSNQDRRNTSFWNIGKLLPFSTPYGSDGSLTNYPWPGSLDRNPLVDEDPLNYTNNTKLSRIFMVGFGQWNITDELTFKTNFGVDIFNSQQGIYEGPLYTLSSLNNGMSHASVRSINTRNWTWENTLNYKKNFGHHTVNLLAGTTAIKGRTVTFAAEGKNQPFSTALFYNLAANTTDIRISSDLVESQLASGFGRINYDYKGKYLLTASLRADGSSVLAPGNKWASFPSAAVAWRASDENFLNTVKWLSELKIRASYGMSGNSAIQPYQTQGGLGRIPYAFDETPAIGYWPKNVANITLGWEKTTSLNLGIDFGFLQNRITGSVDFYSTKTNDLLMERVLPTVTGFSSIIDNVGKTKTKGVDINLSSNNYSTKNFRWTSDFNFSAFNEEIVQLSVGGNDVSKAWFVGKPLRVFYDYEKAGIWQASEKDAAAKYNALPGQIKVKDQDGDGKITATNDRIVLGQATPKWTAGLTNTFTYKNFLLSVLIYARVGQMINSDYAGSYYTGGIFNTTPVDYWTPENPTNAYPRPRTNGNDIYLSTLRYLNGSFFKVKDIRMQYTLNKTGIRKLPFQSAIVYVTAKNYFTFSKVENYDPERGGSGEFPLTKQLVVGLNFSF